MTDLPPSNLCYDAGSRSLAFRIVLEELGIPYTAHRVSARLADDEASSPAWRRRDPKRRVPALSPIAGRAGGEPPLLTGVPAIMTYLARLRSTLDVGLPGLKRSVLRVLDRPAVLSAFPEEGVSLPEL